MQKGMKPEKSLCYRLVKKENEPVVKKSAVNEGTDPTPLGMNMQFIEPNINREASQYIVDNYERIKNNAVKFNVSKDMVSDLINDVYLSIYQEESEGNGYDMERFDNGTIIAVEQYVYGMIKKYSMNVRYRHIERKTRNKGAEVCYEVIPAGDAFEGELDEMDAVQKVYSMVSTCDDEAIDNIDETISVQKCIDYCICYDEEAGMSMLELFKNIDTISTILEQVNMSMFSSLRELLEKDEEFALSFYNVIGFSSLHKKKFKTLIQKYY